jgi:cytochrome c-type biogenesis protein CcmF
MIPELGHFAMILALLLAVVQGTLPIIGAAKGMREWMAVARPAAFGQAFFVAFAWGCLVYSFVTSDFSVINVATNSNTLLPVEYKVAASWGSHEGSLLLWVLMLAGWGLAVAIFSRHLPEEMVARVLGVMGLVSIGFITFMLATSDPFDRMFPAAVEGRDLNPLLQDPGMVFHPPLLYMGYVGFSVAFSFAIAALLGGKLDAAWARWSRPWTTVAWCFLTLGIALGSWWAYYELGWGGWWFWDPVENASFVPWLIGTALIHSLAVTEKRGTFKAWTVLLAIFAFSMSLLGTFLVRSGVLTSVHAFATDPARGVFILIFLVLVIGSSLALFAWRAPSIGLGGRFEGLSRESLLLGNNVLLAVATGTVLLGTLYPLFLDALGMGKISVGPPYFDAVFVPVMAPLVFLMGVGPIARWKSAQLPDLWTRLKWALAISLILGVSLPFVAVADDPERLSWTPMAAFGYWMAAWIAVTTLEMIRRQIRHAPGSLLARLGAQPRGWWGMILAHLGIAVFIVGVTSVRSYEVERDVKISPGEVITVDEYTFKFNGVKEVDGPNFRAAQGNFTLFHRDRVIDTLEPEKRVFFARASEMPMTEAAIRSSITGDVYVSLGEPVGDGAWTARIYYKPFVTWIWGGCVLMALGGFVAMSDRRYRALARREELGDAGRGPKPAAA